VRTRRYIDGASSSGLGRGQVYGRTTVVATQGDGGVWRNARTSTAAQNDNNNRAQWPPGDTRGWSKKRIGV
jgi:hypothetical protein